MRTTTALLVAALLAACGDGGGEAGAGGGAGGGRDAAPRPDAAAPDGAARDAAPDATLFLDGAPPPDAAPFADGGPLCPERARVCLADGTPAFRECRNGQWVVDACPQGELCAGEEAACLPDPATCAPGTVICLDGVPTECAGGAYMPLEACREGTLCSGAGLCRDPGCAVAEDRRSYLGCDYVAAALPNLAYAPVGATPQAPLGVVVANPDPGNPVKVWARDAAGALAPLVGEVTIPPPIVAAGYQAVTVRSELRDASGAVVAEGFTEADGLDIPPRGMAVLLFRNHGYTEQSKVAAEAWRVSTDAPVAATQFGPYCCNYSFTNDASLLLPTSALGTDHRVIGVPSWSYGREDGGSGIAATISVVAPQAQTDVTITLPPGARVRMDGAGRLQRNGDVVTVRLGGGELVHLFSEAPEAPGVGAAPGIDLSGARVESNRPVAVFTGHQCTYYPQDQEACDHLEEQLSPVDTWGNELVLAPVAMRARDPQRSSEAVYWKILAARDATTVRFSVPLNTIGPRPPGSPGVTDCRALLTDGQMFQLDAGESCEFGSDQAIGVNADGPISAIGIISGQASTGALTTFGAHAGDPSIFQAPPVRQLRSSYTFLAPTTYHTDTVTIFAPPDATFEIDGVERALVRLQPVPGTNWVYGHLGIEDGTHFIQGSRPFGMVVFAYDDYVSYAFTGGLNLDKR
jgi:hypothetical protein